MFEWAFLGCSFFSNHKVESNTISLTQLRSARSRIDGESVNLKNLSDRLAPANNAHLDQEPSSAVNLVHRLFLAEADKLLSGRFRIIK